MRTLLRADIAHLIALASLFCSVTSALAAPPQTYTCVDLFTLALPDGSSTYSVGSGNGGIPVVGGQVVGNTSFGLAAILWQGPNGDAINLHPSGYQYSGADGTDGVHQVGYAYDFNFQQHAMLWSGSAASAVDLHPTNLPALNLTNSFAIGVHGTQVVGSGSGHALLWNGSANSAVDLTPTNLGTVDGASALATDGIHQVGFANFVTGSSEVSAPILWSGTAESAIDLSPTNLDPFNVAVLNSVSGGQEVGYGLRFAEDPPSNSYFHALLWNGSSTSAVDLNPTNLTGYDGGAFALSTNGTVQVGFGRKGVNTFDGPFTSALLWNGAADTAVDLNTLLPFLAKSSTANSIDADGNVFGIATDTDGNVHAVEWSPVPEPSTFLLAALAPFVVVQARVEPAKSKLPATV